MPGYIPPPGGGVVVRVEAGDGISVNQADPTRPVVTATGVASIEAGDGITVDATDPTAPVVAATGVQSVVAGDGVTVDDTDPANPVVAASGGSSTGWTEHILSTDLADYTAGDGTWASVAGVFSQTDATAFGASLVSEAQFPGVEFVIEADVRIPTGQDAGAVPQVAVTAWVSPTDLIEHATGIGVIAEDFGDAGPLDVTVANDGGIIPTTAAPTIPFDAWHTIRVHVSLTTAVVYIDGAFAVQMILALPVPSTETPGPCSVGITNVQGLVDVRNLTVWTRDLPA